MAKMIEVTALREFSNTIMGNVTTGQRLQITPERYRVWAEQGLVERDTVDINKMNKKELEAFARERFDIELDRRSTLASLRADVQALLDCID